MPMYMCVHARVCTVNTQVWNMQTFESEKALRIRVLLSLLSHGFKSTSNVTSNAVYSNMQDMQTKPSIRDYAQSN